MKLIHLSDLHLGKRVNEISMLEDQKFILDRILNIIDDEKPQAVLICGDVYDKSVPSAEAVSLFDEFLFRLSRRELRVFVISGNHDSPERLAFGGRLMEGSGIYISPVYDGTLSPVTLFDSHGPVHFWLLPFIKPAHVRRFMPEEPVDSSTDAVRLALREVDRSGSERNVLLAHQFVTGGRTCDSEEFSVGGADNVDASVFEGFDYVALGHLHGAQNIGSCRVRYCGTPLKYSFSEIEHCKSVSLVEMGEKGELRVDTLPLVPRHDMRRLRGDFARLMEGPADSSYLYIELTDEENVPEAIGRLRGLYPNIMHLSYDNTRTRSDKMIDCALQVRKKTALELFGELYELQNNRPMSIEQERFMTELMDSMEGVSV